jgi:hypothetical protein
MHSPGMQLCSFHDFVDCREGFEVLAEVYVPYFRGSAISIAQVGCAMVNADRDIVQQETAGFWHCHDVLAVPVSLYLSRFEFFYNFEFISISINSPFCFCIFSLELGRPSGSIGRWLEVRVNMMVAKISPNGCANRGGSIARPSVLLWDLLPSRFEKVAFLCP